MRQNIGVDAAGSRAMRSDLATSSYAQEGNACWGHSQEAAVKDLSSSTCSDEGILVNLALLPPKTLVTEDGLARLLGKGCRETIKRAVERDELPRPIRFLGKNTWTVDVIINHIEDRLAAEARRFARARS